MHDQPGGQSTVLRLLDVFVDGLQVRDAQGERTASRGRRQETGCAKEDKIAAALTRESAAGAGRRKTRT
jgi:hypothetical protein